jgi:hypothetical protein
MNPLWRVAAFVLMTAFLPLGSASAHCIVGNRFFPATLNIDDPCVADELSFPTISSFSTGDRPAARQLDISGEFSKRITEDFGISVGSTWSRISMPGAPVAYGFQNLETAFTYQLIRNPEHEFAMTAGLNVEWGGTGATAVGAERLNSYAPTFNFGKGFGDLPDSAGWLRAFALTGSVGYAIPGASSTTEVDPDSGDVSVTQNPRFLQWGGSLQYSMPYLKSAVVDLGLPDFMNRLVPIVEAQFVTPVSNTIDSGTKTTGTINPGVIYVAKTYQLAVEGIVPINRDSGANVGVMGQLHLYLDDLFPNGIGRPVFASGINTARTSR